MCKALDNTNLIKIKKIQLIGRTKNALEKRLKNKKTRKCLSEKILAN